MLKDTGYFSKLAIKLRNGIITARCNDIEESLLLSAIPLPLNMEKFECIRIFRIKSAKYIRRLFVIRSDLLTCVALFKGYFIYFLLYGQKIDQSPGASVCGLWKALNSLPSSKKFVSLIVHRTG